jgi:hypothetical protein
VTANAQTSELNSVNVVTGAVKYLVRLTAAAHATRSSLVGSAKSRLNAFTRARVPCSYLIIPQYFWNNIQSQQLPPLGACVQESTSTLRHRAQFALSLSLKPEFSLKNSW